MATQRKKVGAGWMKTTQDGKKFISIVINNGLSPDINLTVWTNSYKEEGSNQPDYVVYLNPPPEAKSTDPAKAQSPEFPEPGSGIPDDDVPF